MPPTLKPSATLEDRFWAKVQIVFLPDGRHDPHACWLWTGAKTTGQPNGAEPRGHVYAGTVDGRKVQKKAHVVALELSLGRPIRKYYDVCHDGGVDEAGEPKKCDSPLCCNPLHLFEAKHSENVRQWVLSNRRKPNGHWTPRPEKVREEGEGLDAQEA